MAARRLTVLIAIDDPGRAEELAVFLAEERGLYPLLRAEWEPGDHADVVISDGALFDEVTPHLVLSHKSDPRVESVNSIAGVLPVETSNELVASAARLAASGYRMTGPQVTGALQDTVGPADDMPADEVHLSVREWEVLALLAEGAPNKTIARKLDISVHTAKFHVASILAKLGAVNRTDAIATAMREGLVHL